LFCTRLDDSGSTHADSLDRPAPLQTAKNKLWNPDRSLDSTSLTFLIAVGMVHAFFPVSIQGLFSDVLVLAQHLDHSWHCRVFPFYCTSVHPAVKGAVDDRPPSYLFTRMGGYTGPKVRRKARYFLRSANTRARNVLPKHFP
jgi:hypothetical protein